MARGGETSPSARAARAGALRVGFVPLLDAAPLLVADAEGFFADEGLRVALERQIGWGNVRDKLSYGQLHASHALHGMTVISALSGERFIEPLLAIAALGSAGNAITFSRRLTDSGVTTAAGLRRTARPDGSRRAILACVFGCSVHHYLLRDWLAAGGLNPDDDVRLIVLPPPQMDRQLAAGTIDGFCVGEPWSALAETAGHGRIVATGEALVPGHPDKVLAVTGRWLAGHAEVATALVRATVRGLQFCQAIENRSRVVETLSRPGCLDLPPELIDRAMSQDVTGDAQTLSRPTAERVVWLIEQMARWGHAPNLSRAEALALARRTFDDRPHAAALDTTLAGKE